jgi:hypothetical protein
VTLWAQLAATPPNSKDFWVQLATPILAVMSMIAALLATLARKDNALTSAKLETLEARMETAKTEMQGRADTIRTEIRADMAAMELRIMSAIHAALAAGKEPERLARIEERMAAMQKTIEDHASAVQLRLASLAHAIGKGD